MGLGDLIEWFTKKTGIKWLVEKIWGKTAAATSEKKKQMRLNYGKRRFKKVERISAKKKTKCN